MAGHGTILVVDDNAKNRSLCRQNLEMEGYEVLEAVNGRQGVKVALASRPHLVLLDIMMPEMDGYQALEALRAEPELADLSILMLTARAGSEDVVRALDLGANDYLRKPFDIDEMVARAHTLVKLSQAQEALRAHQRQMESEMNQAALIQAKMLPAPEEMTALAGAAGLAIAAATQPSSQVNGDFFDIRLTEEVLSIAMCDCKGHGVWAGLMSMTVRALLRSLPPSFTSTRENLTRIEKSLVEMVPEGEFVAMSQWLYDPRDSRITLSLAGMPAPLLVRASDGAVRPVECQGRPPLGLNRFLGHVRTAEVELEMQPGDKLVAYSDGLSEAMNVEDELFGIPEAKLVRLVAGHAGAPAAELAQAIWDAWRAFVPGLAEDDCTLLVLEKL